MKKLIFTLFFSIILVSNFANAKQEVQPTKSEKYQLDIKHKNRLGEEVFDTIEVEDINGKLVFGGDMVLGSTYDLINKTGKFSEPLESGLSGSLGSVNGIGDPWPQSIVPYSFNPSYTTSQRNTVLNAMNYLEATFGVNFVERTNQSNYVYITYGTDFAAGSSEVGMLGGKQTLWLNASKGFNQRTIVHEVLHTMGYLHEHQRSDRDNYIVVNWSNLDECESSFDIENFIDTSTSYDIGSIMHYGSYTTVGCVNNASQPMFTRVGGGTVSWTSSLSSQDAEKAVEDYGYTQGTQINWESFACKGQGNISWSPIANAQSYKIEVKTGGANWYSIASTSSTQKVFLGSNGVQSTSKVRVIGINAAGERSAESNIQDIIYYNYCQ